MYFCKTASKTFTISIVCNEKYEVNIIHTLGILMTSPMIIGIQISKYININYQYCRSKSYNQIEQNYKLAYAKN